MIFSLYVLFYLYRSRDNTQGNCSFQILSWSGATVHIICEKKKGHLRLGVLLGKRNIQAKEVYCGKERGKPRG